jgi:hypothetical protein
MGEVWEQLEGEPDAAYARFLSYRNLGPARSLNLAYQVRRGPSREGPSVAGRRQKASKGGQRAPGSWYQECVRFDWKRRAEAWDVHTFMGTGEQAVVMMVNLIHDFAARTLAAVAKREPVTWSEVRESLNALAALIPQASITRLHARLDQEARFAGTTGPGCVPAPDKANRDGSGGAPA